MSRLSARGGVPVVHLTGSPYRQGLEHGRAFADLIATNVAEARAGSARLAERGRVFDEAGIAKATMTYACEQMPELEDELVGLSRGSGVDFDDLVTHNFPIYVLASLMPFDCSQVVCSGDRFVDGQARMAKTRDVKLDRMRNVVLHRTLPDRETVELTVAGCLTLVGTSMNSDGLRLGTSGVWAKARGIDDRALGKAWVTSSLDEVIRTCSTIDDVEHKLRTQRRLTNINLCASDASGAAAVLEMTVDGVVRHDHPDGNVVRTNHYLSPELADRNADYSPDVSTYHRWDVISRAITEPGPWDDEHLWRLMASHEGYPQLSICRHRENDHGSETTYGSVLTWPEGVLEAWVGHPCERALSPQDVSG